MHPFHSINDNDDPISYIDQAFHHKPFLNDHNNLPPPPFSFSHFASPIFFCSEVDDVFFHNHVHDPFSQNQQPLLETNYFAPEISVAAHMIDPVKNIDGASSSGESKDITSKVGEVELLDNKGLKKKATTSKRDRHSKINTAQGPRDRRMRLSLDIARRFFGLQDVLGFDKASKTVEWLLNKSKSEIKKLAKSRGQILEVNKQMNDSSSSSECEEVSGLDEVSTLNEDQLGIMSISNKKPSPDNKLKENKKTRPSSSQRKVTFDIGAKESRAKARERARERTKNKMRSRSGLHYESKPVPSNGDTNNQEQLTTTQMSSSCWSVPFGPQSHNSMNNPSSLQALAEAEKLIDSFAVNGKLSQFNKINYPHSNWGNFQENWSGDFAFHHKLWEASTSN